MAVTRAMFDDVVKVVQSGGRPIFTEYDVFADVDDDKVASFDPMDHGRGHGFLLWSKSAAAAWEKKALTQPFALHFGGSPARLSMVFARKQLSVRLDVDEETHQQYGHTGTVVIAPDADAPNDLRKLVAAFDELGNDHRVVALACTAYTQSDGWSDVAERSDDDGQTACFWTEQGHEAFDPTGTLTSTLHLYWRGNAVKIARVLRERGFSVVVPENDNTSIQVSVVGDAAKRAPFIPRFADVLPSELRPGTRAADVVMRGAGRFRVDVATRSPERKPVQHIALPSSSRSPSSIALAVGHRDDVRGGPERSVVIFDDAGRVFATPERREWSRPGCGGLAFLDDKSLVVAWDDYLPRASFMQRKPPPAAAATAGKRVGGRRVVDRSAAAQAQRPAWDTNGSAVVLEVLDLSRVGTASEPVRGTGRELRVFGFDHAPSASALWVSRDKTKAAIPCSDGIVVVDLATGAEVACIGGPPLGAYPVLAGTPPSTEEPKPHGHGEAPVLLWSLGGGPSARFLGVDGVVRGETDALLQHHGGRGFRHVAVDPTATVAAFLCERHGAHLPTSNGPSSIDRSLEIFAVDGGARTWRHVEDASRGARSFAFHPYEPLVAFGREDGSVALVDVKSGRALETAPLLDAAVTAFAFSDDGERFAAGDEDGRVTWGAFGR